MLVGASVEIAIFRGIEPALRGLIAGQQQVVGVRTEIDHPGQPVIGLQAENRAVGRVVNAAGGGAVEQSVRGHGEAGDRIAPVPSGTAGSPHREEHRAGAGRRLVFEHRAISQQAIGTRGAVKPVILPHQLSPGFTARMCAASPGELHQCGEHAARSNAEEGAAVGDAPHRGHAIKCRGRLEGLRELRGQSAQGLAAEGAPAEAGKLRQRLHRPTRLGDAEYGSVTGGPAITGRAIQPPVPTAD